MSDPLDLITDEFLATGALYVRCARRALMEVYEIGIEELIEKIIGALTPTQALGLDETRRFLERFDEFEVSDQGEVLYAMPNMQEYVKIFLESHDANSEEVRKFQAVWGRGMGPDMAQSKRPKPILPTVRLNTQMAPSPDDAVCAICYEEVEMGTLVAVLPCGHWYHVKCGQRWVYNRNQCPKDRSEVYGFPEDFVNQAIHFGMMPGFDDSDDSE